jgi:hypothetical protein
MLALASLMLAAVAAPSVQSSTTRGFVGIDWLPLGPAELAWIDQGRLSGTGAAETDGNLQATLRLHGGPTWGRHAALFGLSTWRETTTVWGSNPEDGSDLITTVRRGAVRPSATYRWWASHLATDRPLPFVDVGVYGVIPTVKYSSESWNGAEQDEWDRIQGDDRTRIAGFGLSAGGGVEVRWDNGLSLGARQSFVAHRGQDVSDDQSRISVLLQTETALTLGFVLGRP